MWTWRAAPARRTAKVGGRATVLEPKLMVPCGAHLLTPGDRSGTRGMLDPPVQARRRFALRASPERAGTSPRRGSHAGPIRPGVSHTGG